MPSAAKLKRLEKAKKSNSDTSKTVKSTAVETTSQNVQLVFPATLTPRQRAVLHAVGETYGLGHASLGEGTERHIVLGNQGPNAHIVRLDATVHGDEMSDDVLAALVRQHLNVDASEAFSEPPKSNAQAQKSSHVAPTTKPIAAGTTAVPSADGNGAGRNGNRHVDVDQFVKLMTELVELERQAEVQAAEATLSDLTAEKAQARGRALLNLRLADAEGGLLGRTLLTLVRNKPGSAGEDSLPPHKFSPHDIVRIRAAKQTDTSASSVLAEGVVYRVKETSITIAVEDVPDEGLSVPLKLEKLANQVTYDRLRTALRELGSAATAGQGPATALVEVLFGCREPRCAASMSPWTPINPNLDNSQRQAVALALSASDIALIHGPPGTGKTTATVEVIAQEVARGSRVLACAASNIAVDNLVERLAALKLPDGCKLNVVRVGHPARLLPQVLNSSLEAKVLQSDDSALARDCRREIKDLNAQLFRLSRRDRVERQRIRRDLRQLAKEERQRQERAIATVLANADVVCATLTGVGTRQLSSLPPFDVVVIDEAAQALEPACWAALLRGRRAVLAGDHLQLPPTVTSEEAARRGLLTTLFERIHGLYGSSVSCLLTTQYRMHSAIMMWSSEEMYEGKLEAHASVAAHELSSLPGTNSGAGELPVLLLIDTAGCDMEEETEEGGESRLNRGEAAATMQHVQKLISAGVAPAGIGVITPYAAQVGLLRELRPDGVTVEISTVDGFQGREKEAIVISAVRSNTGGEVGFLADSRRMNVAVTRARRHCALVINSDTAKADAFLGRLVTYFEEHGEYASAAEYA